MFIESFSFPSIIEEENCAQGIYKSSGEFVRDFYPFGILTKKDLRELDFSCPVTILYGGNGSGKSTVLNIIAECLKLERSAPFNSSACFEQYLTLCRCALARDEKGHPLPVPEGSAVITSDDVFDRMLTLRTGNEQIRDDQETERAYHDDVSYAVRIGMSPKPKLAGMNDYERYRREVRALNKNVTRRQFILREAGTETRLMSNGETALAYFDSRLKNDRLYLLDEPENSLSARLQEQLANILSEAARYCGDQLIIATHSPFLLAMPGARIYNLDETPVGIRPWWELENMRIYERFFRKNSRFFTDAD